MTNWERAHLARKLLVAGKSLRFWERGHLARKPPTAKSLRARCARSQEVGNQ